METLEELGYLQIRAGGIEVQQSKRKQLAESETAPIKDLEGVPALQLVAYRIREPQVLVPSPEEHLATLRRPHLGGSHAGVLQKSVEPDNVVENGAELIVEGSDVGWGVRIPVIVQIRHKLVLPANHIDELDLVDAHIAEVREDLAINHVLLRVPGVLAQPGLHLAGIHLAKRGEG